VVIKDPTTFQMLHYVALCRLLFKSQHYYFAAK